MAKKKQPAANAHEAVEELIKTEAQSHRHQHAMVVDFDDDAEQNPQFESLDKSLKNLLDRNPIQKLAFDRNPTMTTSDSVYSRKDYLLPESMLKRIAIQDDLVAAILQARASQASAFGRPRSSRFGVGYVLEPHVGVTDDQNKEQKAHLEDRIERAVKLLRTCGNINGYTNAQRLTFSQYLSMIVRDGLTVGRFATEVRKNRMDEFHSFRPADAGTIFRAAHPKDDGLDQIRLQGEQKQAMMEDEKTNLRREDVVHPRYDWIQVIDGVSKQVFTEDEMLVHQIYPSTMIELKGYPLTPLDTVILAVTTHLNITQHNKLYFQSGRASRGMLVFKTDVLDNQVLKRMQHQFNATINGTKNAWRLPVFGINKEDELSWVPLDSQGGGRDMEFQYLTDMNARVILSAFQMSPDELPGWSYLSKGTNSSALSESNNQYQLEAARDLGIRPLLAQLEDFVQTYVLPLVDPGIEDQVDFKLVGLDSDTPEKEATFLANTMPLYGTLDDMYRRVEKKPLGRSLGGEFPLSQAWQQVSQSHLYFGVILEELFGVEGASKDPNLQFIQNPFWFQFQELLMKKQEMQQAMQQQQAAGQQQQQIEGSSGGQPSDTQNQQAPGTQGQNQDRAEGGPEGPTGGDTRTENQKDQAQDESTKKAEALGASIDDAMDGLGKAEGDMNKYHNRLRRHVKVVDDFMAGWKHDAQNTTDEIIAGIDRLLSRE